MKQLFQKLQQKLAKKPYLYKIVSNIQWLVFDKLFRMGVGLFIGAWVTRYLGPEQFGLLNYALALVSFLVIFSIFGLNSITVKSLVNHPDETSKILGSSCFVQLITSFFTFSLLLILTFYLIEDQLTQRVILILGLGLVFKPIDTIRYYFEANTQSKYIVWAENCSFIICSAIKILFILCKASFISIVWIFFIDGLIASSFILFVYFYKKQTISTWKIDWTLVKQNLKDGLPLAFAGLTIMIYMRIDQLMLGYLLDYSAVGIYSAATKISEVWYFIPMVIVASVNPTLLATRLKNKQAYQQQLRVVTSCLIIISFLIALITTFCSDFIIHILYGEAYKQATSVLVIHIWTGIFVSLGVISGQWFIIENLYLLHLYRSLFGAIINVILNFVLIPYLGIIGAALATLIAQICTALFFDLFDKRTRQIFWMKVRSLNLFYSIKELLNWQKNFN